MFSQIYTQLVCKIIFPAQEYFKSHSTRSILKDLEKSQWLSPDQIKAQQSERLQNFIQNIYQHVPYYKELFDRLSIEPGEIKSSDDLQQLPFLDKDGIRNNLSQLQSDVAGHLSEFNTGGSSGEPLTFLLGKERVSHDVAEKWRATRWWGVDIGDKEIVAWGSPIELGSQDRVRILRDRLMRSELIPAFEMSHEKVLEFIHRIKEVKPKMLFGYPSVFDLLATTAKEQGIQLNDLGIKVAFVTSERLYPYQRSNIEDVFGCPVANGYGGRDAGFIAHQCPSGGMHLSAEDIVVEIIDPLGKVLPVGESGEIVVTHMGTSEFPFVRYRTGDIATISSKQCACGRGLPMLEALEGRSTDFIAAKDGTLMHGLALIYVLREIEGVVAFKIIQESLELTRVLVVPKISVLQEGIEQLIISGFKARLGQDVTIQVETTSEIAPEKSGKYRYVVSKVTI